MSTHPRAVSMASANVPSVESWVEISSQPSSSSLSSIGDEIVTTGLRVQSDPNIRRRRRTQVGIQAGITGVRRQTSTSSQDEYDESESEEDHIMTSSNEHVAPLGRVPPSTGHLQNAASDSDDEVATALGRVTDEPLFTPQPNAFSHPPSTQSSQRQPVPGSYFPRHPVPPGSERQSYVHRSASRPQHTPFNTISPAHQVDHDAALRASLTTLLSCAAAARGLPKRSQSNIQSASTSARPEFTGLRLVPESELIGEHLAKPQSLSPSTRPRSSPSISDQDPIEKGKRKAVVNKTSPQSRASKKKRMAAVEEAMISPTLLTWVVSAGVVMLVSVVGFGAGYVIGKEVGRQETLSGLSVSDNSSCGKEAVRQVSGIRRFRWGNGSAIAA